MEEVAGLETADALRFAKIRRSDWNNALGRGLYTEAPSASAGRARTFDTDDLVAAYVMGRLFECEVLPRFACQIAVEVRRELRKSRGVMTLSAWKVFNKRGQARAVVAERSPAPDAIQLFVFEVARIRDLALAEIHRRGEGSIETPTKQRNMLPPRPERKG